MVVIQLLSPQQLRCIRLAAEVRDWHRHSGHAAGHALRWHRVRRAALRAANGPAYLLHSLAGESPQLPALLPVRGPNRNYLHLVFPHRSLA